MLQPATLHAARAALALVGVGAAEQARALLELEDRLDRTAARARRDSWLCQAYHLLGDVRVLVNALIDYEARIWPCLRHLAAPPEGSTPLRVALFNICQAATDAGAKIPGARQIRRLVE